MNFSPFTGHFPATIPTIHQFAAKFTHDGSTNTIVQGQDVNRYHTTNVAHFNQHHTPLGMAVNVGKFRQPDNIVSIGSLPNAVGNGGQQNIMHSVNTGGIKYQTISASSSSAVGLNNIPNQYTNHITIPYSQQITTTVDSIQQQQNNQQLLKVEQRNNPVNNDKLSRDNAAYQQRREGDIIQQQDMMNTNMMHTQGGNTTIQTHQQTPGDQSQQQTQQLVVVLHETKDPKIIKQETRIDRDSRTIVNNGNEFLTWQSLAAPGSAVADYLSQLPASALPLGLHHLLKYSTSGDGKRDDGSGSVNNILTAAVAANGLNTVMPANVTVVQTNMMGQNLIQNVGTTPIGSKKKKKKKPPKEKKPRPKPGEIRLTTALDGSTLYCCPECHMAYPERGMLEQHLVGHTMERRFICDICNAALKRKDHLTRHKQSHNPERPFVCSVCLKAFKRKEQLTLHFVIHSGEKRHICQECGKGFYRKDHLRKHTRSHIARRVKAELSQQGASTPAGPTLLSHAVPAPSPAS